MSDIVYAADVPTGYALISDPTAKEHRYCRNKGIDILEAGIDDLLAAAGFAACQSREAAVGVGR